jgi:hypothetical protein
MDLADDRALLVKSKQLIFSENFEEPAEEDVGDRILSHVGRPGIRHGPHGARGQAARRA